MDCRQLNITYLSGPLYEDDDDGMMNGTFSSGSNDTDTDSTMTVSGIVPPSPNHTIIDSNVTTESNYSPSPNFCFNESQSWVGTKALKQPFLLGID